MSQINLPFAHYYTFPLPTGQEVDTTISIPGEGSFRSSLTNGKAAVSTGGVAVPIISGGNGRFRPAGSVITSVDKLTNYTKTNNNETITGDWNFVGDLLINGAVHTANDTYVHTEVNSNYIGSTSKEFTITHGLGTDDVIIDVMVYVASNAPTLVALAARPDGLIDEWHAWIYSGSASITIPATGNVTVKLVNTTLLTRSLGFIAVIRKA